MTERLAIEIAKDFMRDRGLKRKDYMLRYRHLRLDAAEKRVLKGENQLLILLQGTFDIKIQSKAGVFEWSDQAIAEMQHVHRGLVNITNSGFAQADVYLLQVIPKNKKKK